MRPNCMHFILFVVICMLLGNMCWYFMCDRRQFLLFCTPVWLFVCPSICTIVWAQVWRFTEEEDFHWRTAGWTKQLYNCHWLDRCAAMRTHDDLPPPPPPPPPGSKSSVVSWNFPPPDAVVGGSNRDSACTSSASAEDYFPTTATTWFPLLESGPLCRIIQNNGSIFMHDPSINFQKLSFPVRDLVCWLRRSCWGVCLEMAGTEACWSIAARRRKICVTHV